MKSETKEEIMRLRSDVETLLVKKNKKLRHLAVKHVDERKSRDKQFEQKLENVTRGYRTKFSRRRT